MKNFLVVIVLMLVMCVVVSPMVQAQSSTSLASSKAYVNSQSDTATLPSNIGVYGTISLTYTVRDTAAADVYVSTKPKGQATASWTTVYTDSVIYANTGTNYVKEILLRSTTVDRIAGMNVDVRVRTAWRTGQGVTSATYDNVLIYTK